MLCAQHGRRQNVVDVPVSLALPRERAAVAAAGSMTTVFQRLVDWNERVKHRIHNTRIPIKDKRLLFLVQCGYFFAPLAVGYGIMSATMRDPEEVRREIGELSPEARAKIEEHKRKLQSDMDEARRRAGRLPAQ